MIAWCELICTPLNITTISILVPMNTLVTVTTADELLA